MGSSDEWPVPDEIKGASARDAFLWYIRKAWPVFFNELGTADADERVEVILDHDFGYHLLQYKNWQIELRNIDEFPRDENFAFKSTLKELREQFDKI